MKGIEVKHRDKIYKVALDKKFVITCIIDIVNNTEGLSSNLSIAGLDSSENKRYKWLSIENPKGIINVEIKEIENPSPPLEVKEGRVERSW
ncbi:hypothetical protein C9994_15130, partial [Marivirga lumbricoides]